jgi:hypothetical protein
MGTQGFYINSNVGTFKKYSERTSNENAVDSPLLYVRQIMVQGSVCPSSDAYNSA